MIRLLTFIPLWGLKWFPKKGKTLYCWGGEVSKNGKAPKRIKHGWEFTLLRDVIFSVRFYFTKNFHFDKIFKFKKGDVLNLQRFVSPASIPSFAKLALIGFRVKSTPFFADDGQSTRIKRFVCLKSYTDFIVTRKGEFIRKPFRKPR